MALNKQFRSPHSPSPIYGIRGGFNVGDFEHRGAAEIVGIASTTGSVAAPSAVSPKARVVKVTVNITAGTGSVDVSIKSADDSYSAVVFDSGVLTGIQSFDFFVGGWSTPASGDNGYVATQYGPDVDSNQNFSGGVYNPTNFLSLSGSDIKVYSTVSGTITYNVQITPVS